MKLHYPFEHQMRQNETTTRRRKMRVVQISSTGYENEKYECTGTNNQLMKPVNIGGLVLWKGLGLRSCAYATHGKCLKVLEGSVRIEELKNSFLLLPRSQIKSPISLRGHNQYTEREIGGLQKK